MSTPFIEGQVQYDIYISYHTVNFEQKLLIDDKDGVPIRLSEKWTCLY